MEGFFSFDRLIRSMLANIKSHHKVFKTDCDGEVNSMLLYCIADE